MKNFLGVLVSIFLGILNSFGGSTNQPSTSAEQLRSELEVALKAKDTNAFLGLFNWEGVSNKTNGYANVVAKRLSEFFLKYTTNSIRPNVYLQPLPEDFETEGVVNGFRYRPNVFVKGMMQFSLSVLDNGTNFGDGAQIPYGETNGDFYFAGTTREKIYEPKVKEKPFQITVTSTNFSMPTAYTISYVYLQNDQEIKKTFTCTNSLRRLVWGNELKSCILRKLSSDDNLLKLEISELSTNKSLTLLDSETSFTNTPIIYEEKQP
jgi:hypothetical protein